MPATQTLTCPECGEDVWDLPYGHKLAKCWNTEGHADGGTLAFDTMSDEEERESLSDRIGRLRCYTHSTRFALTVDDVIYDYTTGRDRYAS